MWLQWMWEGFVTGVTKVVSLWWLVLLFIVIQILKDSGLLDRWSRQLRPLLAPLRLPDEAGPPVIAGLAVGLTYGAGVILQVAQEGKLNRDQLTVTCIFLGICHATIEETLLLTSAGANGFLLISIRFVTALILGLIAARIYLPMKAARHNFPADHVDRAGHPSV